MKGYEYTFEDIYDIIVELETIERLIENNNQKQALSNIKWLKDEFKITLYLK
jgi:hypothetical protein